MYDRFSRSLIAPTSLSTMARWVTRAGVSRSSALATGGLEREAEVGP